jgi:membrane protease YdiL (CAAX protease family)
VKREWAAVLRAMLSRLINGGGNPLPLFQPRKHATPREWAALTFAMLFPTLMAWLYFVVLAAPRPLGTFETLSLTRPNLLAQVAYAAGKVLQFAFPLLYLASFDRNSLWASRGGPAHARERPEVLRGPKSTSLALAAGFGLVVGAGILLLHFLRLRAWLIETGTAAMVREKVEEFSAATPARFVFLSLFLAGAHSFLEEYYWRWFVFGRLRHLVAPTWAAVLSSMGFMAHHVIILGRFFPGQFWNAVAPFSLCIAGGGMVWAWLFHRTGSIASPWLSHLIVDAAVMTVGYDLLFGRP